MKLIAFSEIKKRFTPDQERRIAAEVRKAEAEMLLVGLWQQSGRPQRAVAAELGVKHPTLARAMEFDLLEVSTLQRIMKSFCGKIDLIITMDSGRQLKLSPPSRKDQLGPHIEKQLPSPKPRKASRRPASRAA